jgi:integrase
MPTMKLTKQVIDGLHPQDKDKFYWDTEVKGFGVKVTPKGRKTFLVQYRPGGKTTPTRKMSLGAYGTVTPHQAKTEATRILGLRAEGRDPALELRQSRQTIASNRFSDVVDDFIKKHVSQNRSADEVARIIRKDALPKWGARSVHEITKRDINDLLDSVVDRGAPVMANRVLAAIRKFFNWCVSRGIIEISPCNGIAAPHKEKARDRVLSDTELSSVVKAAHQIGGAFGAIVLMLVFTAQRLNEVSRMEWQELDLDVATWTIPGERTKNKKTHNVHLSAHALALLKSAPELGSFVFTTNGRTPFSGFGKAKKRLDDASGVSDWVLHDIRRTVTSGMASIGIAPHIADKILNHQSGTISGVAAVYQRHEFLEERKTALEAWGNYVALLVDGEARDNVIAIPTK